MRKLRFRKGSWLLVPTIILALFATPVKADTITTTGANDFYFELQQGTTFTVRATAWQHGIDSMLWFYDSNNQLLIANDDYFGLDSYISYNVQQTGTYRLRTGVCCGDPNRWYREFYTIETNSTPTNIPTTTSTSTSTTSTSTTTTTIPPYLNSPRNLRISSFTHNSVSLDWEAPEQSNVDVERYAIFWSCDGWRSGFAISSLTTSATINGLNSGTDCEFKVRSDNDTQSIYSNFTEVLPVTTATTTTTSTTTSTSTSTTTSTTTTTVPVTTTTNFIQSIFPSLATTTTSSTTTSTTSTTSTTTTTVPETTTTTTTIPPIVEKISQEEAVAAATSPEKLQEVTKEEAQQIFNSIDVAQITEEEKTKIIDAVQDAPKEVKEAFEGEIDIYGDGFDEYVPVGSTIPVKARRTLLAAVGAISSVSVVGGSTGGSTPSGGSSNTPSGSGGESGFKKDEDEEEDEEEAPEIEGPEGGDDDEIFTRNSIFKYGEDGMKKFSIWNFIKKFSRETAALAFTISSTVIVFATLSGDTRKITLIATACAFGVHYLSVMIKNDE